MWGLGGRVVAATPAVRRVGLTRTEIEPELLAAWRRDVGPPATLAGVLGDLDRRARPARLWRTPTAAAFRWDEPDLRTKAWVPQGVTTSADAGAEGTVHGREVVVASWYLRTATGPDQAARVTFVDVTDPTDPHYRHVLLVEPSWEPGGRPGTRPVPVHAGGVGWYGDLLYVAGTYGGLRVFDLGDLVRAEPAHDGFDYLLPQRWAYRPTFEEEDRLRFSFVSVDRTSAPHGLLAGEYGRGDNPVGTRVVRFPLAAATGQLCDAGGVAEPTQAFGLDVPSMQGAACADDTWFVSSSNGRYGRGHLWVGDPARGLRRHRRVLPAGPEDLSVQPSRGLLWSLTEWPGRRVMFALRTADWPGP
jgi:hypothetical protein